MSLNSVHRKLVVSSLLPDSPERLLDIGSGPVTPDYPFSKRATQVTCLDWKMTRIEPIPSNVRCLEGDFTLAKLPAGSYDAIIASDVFEHILLEQEPVFATNAHRFSSQAVT